MSDDGTNAVKKIAYCIQLESTLVQASGVLSKMCSYPWTVHQGKELEELGRMLDDVLTRSSRLINSFYKAIE